MCYDLDLPLNSLFILIEKQKWKDVPNAMRIFPGMGSETFEIPNFYEDPSASAAASAAATAAAEKGKTCSSNSNSKSKVTALHLACKYQAPSTVIKALHKENPKQFFMLDSKYQRTALHIAIMNGAPSKTIQILLKYNPQATEHQDALGRLPLHYTFRTPGSEKEKKSKKGSSSSTTMDTSIFKSVLQSSIISPQMVVRQSDASGFLPLHVACRCQAPLSVIKVLVQIAPDTIMATTKKGSTVLSCAKLGKCDATILKYLEQKSNELSQQ